MPQDPFRAQTPVPPLPPAAPLDGRPPRLLAHVLRAMPSHNAGAERMLHTILEGLAARGWDVRLVAVEHRGDPYERNGIPIEARTDAQVGELYAWCDVAVTHLDITPMAMAWARHGRPLLHLVHNHRQLLHHRVPDNGHNAAVWNSSWIIEQSGGWNGPQVLVRPPVTPADHATAGGGYKARTAVLVNLLDQKGGPIFWRLARRLPDWHFVGVEGAYGMQTIPNPMPPNGEVIRQTDDLRDVWERASVCLVPSWYESWGMAAVEALCSGLPVVAHPTPGLRESLGDAAQFADRDDDEAWVAAILSLEDPATYNLWSTLAARRARQLGRQSIADLDRLDMFCRLLAADNQTQEPPT